MAKRHFDKYFQSVCKQYFEMRNDLEELNKADMVVDSAVVDNIKRMIEPLRASYETLSYIAYLLNLPNRESKVKRHTARLKKGALDIFKGHMAEDVKAQNQAVLDRLKETIESKRR